MTTRRAVNGDSHRGRKVEVDGWEGKGDRRRKTVSGFASMTVSVAFGACCYSGVVVQGIDHGYILEFVPQRDESGF